MFLYCLMKLKHLPILLFGVIFTLPIMAQDKPAYLLYNAKGKKISYKKSLKMLSKADIIFFGESHNNSLGHWLEFEVLKDVGEMKGIENIKVGAEMFERHQQDKLEEYLTEKIEEKTFRDSLELWKNYSTDYRPIVEFCKANGIPFFGSNVPRKYARMAYTDGINSLSGLSNEEKTWLVPLPFEIDYQMPSYQNMKTLMGGHGMTDDKLKRFIEAQALKDATMAHFTLENYEPGNVIIHYNGSYHSQDKEGIIWYIKKHKPELEIVTIHTAEQDSIDKVEEESLNKADIIIAIPNSMTKTYTFGGN